MRLRERQKLVGAPITHRIPFVASTAASQILHATRPDPVDFPASHPSENGNQDS